MLGSNIAIGTICALEEKLDLFQRVRVDILTNRDKQGNPRTAFVRSIDEGWTRIVKTYQLYYLPEKLTQPVPQAVDIHLCRLQPRDLDPQWSPAINEIVTKWLHEPVVNEDKQYYLYGRIVLSMGGSLWIDPLECRQYLTTIGISAIHFSFRSRLLQCNLALENPSHLTKLYELCKQGGLELPDYNQERRHRKAPARLLDETLKPDWGFLQTDELNVVFLTSVVTPSSFFVQRLKFQDILEDLNDDICCHQNDQGFKAWKKAPTEPGSFVIARFPGNQMWYRALIESVEPDECFLLFFVDYGDRAVVQFKYILPLPEILLSKLPFQAIECSLSDICPLDKLEWPESAGDLLDSTIKREDDNSFLKKLVIKVTGKTKSTVTGGWRYMVKLFDVSTRTELSKMLVSSNEAQYEQEYCPEDETDETWCNIEKAIETVNGRTESSLLDDDEEDEEEKEEDYEKDAETTTTALVPFYQAKTAKENAETSVEATSSALKKQDPYGFNADEDIDSDSDNDSDIETVLSILPKETKEEMLKIFHAYKPSLKTNDSILEKRNLVVEESHADSTVGTTKDLNLKTELTCQMPLQPLMKVAYEPSIQWSQDEEWVTLTVQLPGVDDYDLYIQSRRVKFLTKSSDRVYFFDKTLFGFVIPDLCKHSAKGQHIEIKLYKLAPFPWLRLELKKMLSSKGKPTLDVDVLNIEGAAREFDDESNTDIKIRVGWDEPSRAGTQEIPTDPHLLILHDTYDEECSDESDDAHNAPATFDPFDPLA